MRARFAQLARLLVLVTVMGVYPTSGQPASTPTTEGTSAQLEQVRLRKLHLVRPDLIPYPISFEVYC